MAGGRCGPDFLALSPRPASFLRAGELMFTPLGVITPSPLGAITPPPGHSTQVAITPSRTRTRPTALPDYITLQPAR